MNRNLVSSTVIEFIDEKKFETKNLNLSANYWKVLKGSQNDDNIEIETWKLLTSKSYTLTWSITLTCLISLSYVIGKFRDGNG